MTALFCCIKTSLEYLEQLARTFLSSRLCLRWFKNPQLACLDQFKIFILLILTDVVLIFPHLYSLGIVVHTEIKPSLGLKGF